MHTKHGTALSAAWRGKREGVCVQRMLLLLIRVTFASPVRYGKKKTAVGSTAESRFIAKVKKPYARMQYEFLIHTEDKTTEVNYSCRTKTGEKEQSLHYK